MLKYSIQSFPRNQIACLVPTHQLRTTSRESQSGSRHESMFPPTAYFNPSVFPNGKGQELNQSPFPQRLAFLRALLNEDGYAKGWSKFFLPFRHASTSELKTGIPEEPYGYFESRKVSKVGAPCAYQKCDMNVECQESVPAYTRQFFGDPSLERNEKVWEAMREPDLVFVKENHGFHCLVDELAVMIGLCRYDSAQFQSWTGEYFDEAANLPRTSEFFDDATRVFDEIGLQTYAKEPKMGPDDDDDDDDTFGFQRPEMVLSQENFVVIAFGRCRTRELAVCKGCVDYGLVFYVRGQVTEATGLGTGPSGRDCHIGQFWQ